MKNLMTCNNCTTRVSHLIAGRCSACNQYLRSHNGTERPPEVYGKQKQPAIRPCVNCDRVMKIHGQDRCATCYAYLKEWNEDIDPEQIRPYSSVHSVRAQEDPIFAAYKSMDLETLKTLATTFGDESLIKKALEYKLSQALV